MRAWPEQGIPSSIFLTFSSGHLRLRPVRQPALRRRRRPGPLRLGGPCPLCRNNGA